MADGVVIPAVGGNGQAPGAPRATGSTRRRAKHRFSSEGPFVKVQKEVSQHADLRRRLLRKLEQHYKARVISYFTSFNDQGGIMTDDDAEMLESILAVEHDEGKVVLVLNSPGGLALAAERIAGVCRAYSEDRFEVVIPHMAKSAATMVCFGASTIHMSKTAELGPVDPQVAYKDDAGQVRWISADEYVRSYQQLVAQAASGKHKRIEPFLQQLNRYDSRYIETLVSAQGLSKDISVRLLKSGMMAGQPDAKITEAIQVFLTQERTSAHGRMINSAEASSCGLNIQLIDLHSETWHILWELYVRSDWAVTNTQAVKLIESSASAVHR